jgi:hypothetical protein
MEIYDGVLYLFGGTDQLDPGKPLVNICSFKIILQSKGSRPFSKNVGKESLSKDQPTADLAC